MAQELRELNEERKNMTDTEAKKAIDNPCQPLSYDDTVFIF